MKEQYQSSQEEIKKAEETMTKEEGEISNKRVEAIQEQSNNGLSLERFEKLFNDLANFNETTEDIIDDKHDECKLYKVSGELKGKKVEFSYMIRMENGIEKPSNGISGFRASVEGYELDEDDSNLFFKKITRVYFYQKEEKELSAKREDKRVIDDILNY